ncbi:MtrAB system accessory lipoprotein LpqB [Corynebacterium hindlerae]|uniref:MtrAB system accessory lipoprotein LpqB n=1 Tax=Corynebacterium hindlerae TaxID=699041 RepID=UPI003AAD58DA
MKKDLRKVLGVIALSSVVLTACTTIPSNSTPQALRSFAPAASGVVDEPPEPNQAPDLLLRDFFRQAVKPKQRHQPARQYLTAEAAKTWDSQAGTLVLDRIDINSKPGASAQGMTFTVRGPVIGSIGVGGVYQPEHGLYEATIDLVKQDGQWRISNLPPGVVVEHTELRNNYQPYSLYFMDPSDSSLVADRRWVYTGNSSLNTALLSLLVEGPQDVLAPGVKTYVPQGATFSGFNDGVYSFAGFGDLNAEGRYRFAAQVVWTLAKAGVPGPYRIEIDDTPIIEDSEYLTIEQVADYNPGASAAAASPLYVLAGGKIMKVEEDHTVPIAGSFSQAGNIDSADFEASSGVIAAVQSSGEGEDRKARLLVAKGEEAAREALEAKTISHPTFEIAGTSLWTVLDGKKVVRVARSTTSGELSQTEVDSSELEGLDGLISVLQLSPTGVRCAFIINGRVYMATVERPSAGHRKLTKVREIAPAIAGTALTVEWKPDGSLLVGTSTAETPVWQVQTDGSALTPLPSGNVTAPVVAISASPSTIYITDSRALLQLPTNTTGVAFWREVPALQGQRAAPVVAK